MPCWRVLHHVPKGEFQTLEEGLIPCGIVSYYRRRVSYNQRRVSYLLVSYPEGGSLPFRLCLVQMLGPRGKVHVCKGCVNIGLIYLYKHSILSSVTANYTSTVYPG